MHEPFFPQLALFVADRSLLSLYREFIFPSVPSRTGLLPISIDDIRATSANTAMAIDIALTRAAVVVYDSSRRSRFSLDYVRAQRTGRAVIVVTAPSLTVAAAGDPAETPRSEVTVPRPAEMSGWPSDFVEPLLASLAAASPTPGSDLVDRELSELVTAGKWQDLLLTGLALLERQMRIADLPTVVPLNPTGGVMERLQNHFGEDFSGVIEAVSLRNRILQNLKPDAPVLRRVASTVADLARSRYGIPVDDAEG